MEFNLEKLKLIAFWGMVAFGELSLTEEDKELLDSINETLEHWNV
jgi:hypothetical protein